MIPGSNSLFYTTSPKMCTGPGLKMTSASLATDWAIVIRATEFLTRYYWVRDIKVGHMTWYQLDNMQGPCIYIDLFTNAQKDVMVMPFLSTPTLRWNNHYTYTTAWSFRYAFWLYPPPITRVSSKPMRKTVCWKYLTGSWREATPYKAYYSTFFFL